MSSTKVEIVGTDRDGWRKAGVGGEGSVGWRKSSRRRPDAAWVVAVA
jgi:hypothetical protein